MAQKVYLEYTIYLTDKALVAQLQATRFRRTILGVIPVYSEAGHPIMAPDDAAVEWDAPIVAYVARVLTGPTEPPRITSPNFNTVHNYPRNVALFSRDTGGFWGWVPGVGEETNFYWRGTFEYAGTEAGESPIPGAALSAMSTRRWIDGMELGARGENFPVLDADTLRECRAASRTPDGLGWHVDGSVSSARYHIPQTSGGAAATALWERFYIRVHRFPLAEWPVWKVAAPASQSGLEMGLLPSGQIALTSVSAAGVRVLLGTYATIAVHEWKKIDVIYQWQTAVPDVAAFSLFINGALIVALVGDGLGPAGQGMRSNNQIGTSKLAGLSDASISIDYDDWIGAAPPALTFDGLGNWVRTAKDWNAGSHVALIGAIGYAADNHASWVGGYQRLRQRIGTVVAAMTHALTSSTSGAILSIETDGGVTVDLLRGSRGIAAMVVGLLSKKATITNPGTLGYKLPRVATEWTDQVLYAVGDRVTYFGVEYDAIEATLVVPGTNPTDPAKWRGVDVQLAIVEATSKTWTAVYWLPVGLIEPFAPLAGLTLKHVKGANVDLTTVEQLCAVAEVIGNFGPEDHVSLTAAELSSPGAQAAAGGSGSVDIVQAVKDGLLARGADLSGACGAFSIVKRVAWALRGRGCGTLEKLTGNNCESRSTDIVAFKSAGTTLLYDVLIDGGGANTPAWNVKTPLAGTDRWRAPVDPGDTTDTGDNPIAAWDAVTAYAVGARVLLADTEYVCILAHTNQTPPGATYWQSAGVPLADAGGEPVAAGPHIGLHNAPYPRTPWAAGASALSPVTMETGVYVGNGTVTELFFDVPIHFLWIRPTTAASGPIVWWPGMTLSHSAGALGSTSGVIDVLMDDGFAGAGAVGQQETRCVVRIVGAGADSNANAANYNYLAISDPGMRFLISDAFQVTNGATDYVNPLAREDWTPEALFYQAAVQGTGATVRLGYKGVGHAADAISKGFAVAEVASGMRFSLGTITAKVGLFTAADSEVAFCAFRRDDGSGDAGIPKVLQLATYVGDGAASRTIPLAPASGLRPMWAIIVPHTAVGPVMRDPSHTGTTSSVWPNTANAATGIVGGGIDQILIGVAYNTAAVVYDVFAIPGCDGAAGNAGWSTACQTIPVDPWTPYPDDPNYPDEPVDPETPAFPWPGDPGGTGGGTDGEDFGTDCVTASTKIINQALGRIGVSKRVEDIVDEASEEAAVARLYYADDVSATLRDFPWSFATRYEQLDWVAGSVEAPVNGDWTYAYRAPSTMMFARRVVTRAGVGRRHDKQPPDFRVGSDDDGALIYTNHADAGLVDADDLTVELEYTIRLTCAASSGDAIFRNCLAWRHAASLAAVLAKDEKKVAFCLTMYERVLATATTKDANEQQQAPEGDADWITGRN